MVPSSASSPSSASTILPIRGVSPSRASSIGTAIHDSMLVLMEGMGELQEQLKELIPLRALPGRVTDLEARLLESEHRERELRAELSRVQDTQNVLTSLISRITREDVAAQAALARLTEEALRLKTLSEIGANKKGGHGVVRTFSPAKR